VLLVVFELALVLGLRLELIEAPETGFFPLEQRSLVKLLKTKKTNRIFLKLVLHPITLDEVVLRRGNLKSEPISYSFEPLSSVNFLELILIVLMKIKACFVQEFDDILISILWNSFLFSKVKKLLNELGLGKS
jgi:hypothetical protein